MKATLPWLAFVSLLTATTTTFLTVFAEMLDANSVGMSLLRAALCVIPLVLYVWKGRVLGLAGGVLAFAASAPVVWQVDLNYANYSVLSLWFLALISVFKAGNKAELPAVFVKGALAIAVFWTAVASYLSYLQLHVNGSDGHGTGDFTSAATQFSLFELAGLVVAVAFLFWRPALSIALAITIAVPQFVGELARLLHLPNGEPGGFPIWLLLQVTLSSPLESIAIGAAAVLAMKSRISSADFRTSVRESLPAIAFVALLSAALVNLLTLAGHVATDGDVLQTSLRALPWVLAVLTYVLTHNQFVAAAFVLPATALMWQLSDLPDWWGDADLIAWGLLAATALVMSKSTVELGSQPARNSLIVATVWAIAGSALMLLIGSEMRNFELRWYPVPTLNNQLPWINLAALVAAIVLLFKDARWSLAIAIAFGIPRYIGAISLYLDADNFAVLSLINSIVRIPVIWVAIGIGALFALSRARMAE